MTRRLGMTAAVTGFVVAATAVAAAAWWPVYEHPRFLLLVGVTVALAAVLSVIAALLRWPLWALLCSSCALFLLAGVPLAVPDRTVAGFLPTAEGLLELVAGVALGWKQLLTITLPVGDYQALLVPVFVLVILSVVAGIRAGLVESRGEWGMLPPVVLFVSGILFGTRDPIWPVPLALGLFGIVVTWLIWRRARRRRATIRALIARRTPVVTAAAGGLIRLSVAGVVILVLAVGMSVGATLALPPTGEREVLREQVEQPFDPSELTSPLSGFRRYLLPPSADEVQFRVSGLAEGERLRLASLDRYDGVVFGISATDGGGDFVRVPSRVDRSGSGGSRREFEVEIVGYEGRWLPSLGLVASAEFAGPRAAALRDGFVVQVATGIAAVSGGLESGDGYRLHTVVPASPGLDSLATATPGSTPGPALVAVPDGLTALLDVWVRDERAPGARLVAMIESLRATGYLSHGISQDEPASRSGHGTDRIVELVTSRLMIGDDEQYAVAAALMARQLGFPSRVVLGFAPEAAGSHVEVRGRDIAAWIEVDTNEHGWVAIDPVPEPRPVPEETPEEAVPVSRPWTIVPPPAEVPPDPDEQIPPENTREEAAALDPLLAALLAAVRIISIGLLVVALALSPFLLIVAAKLRRRRLRRRVDDPLERIRGGWDEFADAAIDHGLTVAPASTRPEFARALGSLPPRVLAAAVDRAVFAPERVRDGDAERVWVAVDELRLSMNAATTRWRRIRALISIRSLGGLGSRGSSNGENGRP